MPGAVLGLEYRAMNLRGECPCLWEFIWKVGVGGRGKVKTEYK